MLVRLKVAGASTAAPASVAAQWVAFEADSVESAMQQAARAGCQVLAVEGDAPQAPRHNTRFPLLLFTQELLALLEAGLNVVEALQTLRRKAGNRQVAQVLDAVFSATAQGQAFSVALQAQPVVFPLLYVASVRAAERTGGLQDALARFITYQTQVESVRKKVITASIYPALLLVVGTLVTLFLLGYVVPRFSAVLDTAGREAPAGSRALLALGSWIHQHPQAVFFGLAVLGAGAALLIGHAGARRVLGQAVLRLPALRRLADAFAVARLYRAVAVLLNSGTPLVQALEMCESLLMPPLARVLAQVRERLRGGVALSDALAGTALLTPVADSLVRVGERSGRLAEMLERAARFEEEELGRRIDILSRLFEPLLMLAIGLVIGLVVVLMYMPIFDLAGSFQ